MLYPENQRPTLAEEVFQHPGSEYRCTPFWAWNCELKEDELLWQIEILKKMGMGGFHMHSRTGMATPYLTEDFMNLVKACVEKAKREKMLAWLYDEDRWPSGAAGGYVTKDEKYRARYMVFTPVSNEAFGSGQASLDSSARAKRQGNGRLLARYAVALHPDGTLQSYRRLADDQSAAGEETTWYAYLELTAPSPWYNNQTYVNTLDKEAIERFVQITHERYKQAVGEDFGKTVPAIFTDEPQFTHKTTLGFATDKEDVVLPWTDDFAQSFKEAYGEDLLDSLPELYWELPGERRSLARYRYHDHVAERFAQAFADTCGNWCRENGLMLTGHMMEEPTLQSQTAALGEAMRSYRGFDLPGIDMLCDYREYTTAKQAQSAAHQYGCPGVLSELYGVTNWDFDFRGHKLAGDWQAALGVTVRVPHLSWVSMKGEAKRDYPASINYQSAWWDKYPLVEDHFARLNTALTRGKPLVKLGVIHPVESYWLHWGPREQTALAREEMDQRFQNLCDWLLFGLCDFDYICESLLPSQCQTPGAPLRVGEMAYETILVPALETIRSTTLDRLEAFVQAGGRLLFLGSVPTLVDARPSLRAAELAARCQTIEFSKGAILSALETERLIDVRDERGSRTDGLLSQLRQDGEGRWLFLCHGRRLEHQDVLPLEKITLRIKGLWKPTLYDTQTGATKPLAGIQKNGETELAYGFYAHDSLLLRLDPGAAEGQRAVPAAMEAGTAFRGRAAYTLSEPNVLLLDQAEYAFDEGPWMEKEEILRADNAFRSHLGFPSRMDAVAQPWVVEKERAEHNLRLRFRILSDIPVSGASLALENAEQTGIRLNGLAVPCKPEGYFVDKAIEKVPLPALACGENLLELTVPVTRREGAEWCYLLGNFGVRLEGDGARLVSLPEKLGFGDWCGQGLPFYCGNVRYHLPIQGKGTLKVRASHYRGALLGMSVDGGEEKPVAYAPYAASFPGLDQGEHCLTVTVYGTRVNGFGAVHNADETTTWFGPNCWRSEGDSWCYEYRLRPQGLLTAPRWIWED